MDIQMHILENDFTVDERIQKLADIHFKMYGIDQNEIIEGLRKYEQIFLFTLGDEPIGNNCAKYIQIANKVVLYWGNAAFLKQFRNRRLLTESILFTDEYCLEHFPDKEVFWSALTLTPISYALVADLIKGGWPRHNKEVPPEIREFKREIIKDHLKVNPIELENGVFLTDVLCSKLKKRLNFPINNSHKEHYSYFEQHNPYWREGYELFVIGPPSPFDRFKLRSYVKYNRLRLMALDFISPPSEEDLLAA